MTVNTLSAQPTATFVREPLALDLSPGEALARLAAEPMPFALTGLWAGGGAILGCAPVVVAGVHDDPFAVLDRLPPVGGSTTPAAGSGRRRLVRMARLPAGRPRRARPRRAAAPGADARVPPRLLRPRAAPRRRRTVVVRGARHARAPRRAGGAPATPSGCAAPRARAGRRSRVAAAAQPMRRPLTTSRRSPRAARGSPPARSFRPTSACGSTATSTAAPPSCWRGR